MNRQTWLIVGGVLLLAAFLVGFIPEYMRAGNLASQLEAAQQQNTQLQGRVQMDELGLLAGRVYLDANQKNFGLASQSSSGFFDRARQMADQVTDPAKKQFLQKALAERDEVTAGLAKADPATILKLQDLFQSAIEASRNSSH